MNTNDDILEGLEVPTEGHLRAIPYRWWLTQPVKAFNALCLMKEGVSAKVDSKAAPEQPCLQGSESRKSAIAEGISLPLVGDVKWSEIAAYLASWATNPLNVALTFWCLLCIVPTAIIVLVDGGFLDRAIPDEYLRLEFVEVSDQILNALFVLMCLVWHPVFCRLSFQLYRWSPQDIQLLRYEYCRKGRRKPNEWLHLSVVFFFFHLTCFATYTLAVLYWVYPRWSRPWWAVLLSVGVSFGAPIVAFAYNILSPLGKDFHLETHQEVGQLASSSAIPVEAVSEQFREYDTSFVLSQKAVPYPEWRGGLLECWRSPRIGWLTCLFPFCVFGFNSERLGFGQAWVQALCFVFIVIGPCLVFQLSVHTTKLIGFAKLLTLSGLLLAWLGLLYGAYWRYRMRTRYRLPPATWCLGSPPLTDAASWLFCCWCALCQEVRTAEYYDVGDDAFSTKLEEASGQLAELAGFPYLGEASKKVGKFRENLEGSLKDAGKGVARLFNRETVVLDMEKGTELGEGASSGVVVEAPMEVRMEERVEK